VNGYPDYRGVEVFGAWAWNPELQIGIATEIDRAEALTSYRTIRALTLSLLILIIGTFAILLAVIRHRNRVVAANDLFQEAIRARQDTLAVVSHDLRAPLSNVLLCSKMLVRSDVDTRDIARLSGVIGRSSHQMEKLISDLLDISEIEMGHLRLEKKSCTIASLLDSVHDTFAESARAKSIELNFSSPAGNPSIIVDPDRIIQVLTNLVGNALKFTPEGGHIFASATVLPKEVRFSVQDTGPGISPEAQPHVFEQFWKARSSGKRGRGLGLYIAKMIVEQHGGRIWLESDGRTGTTFYFTLPVVS
jgi:signal transduction histidine kinase